MGRAEGCPSLLPWHNAAERANGVSSAGLSPQLRRLSVCVCLSVSTGLS